jgi:hypothetical protein
MNRLLVLLPMLVATSFAIEGGPVENVYDSAVNHPDFSTLAAALKAAGLAETLRGPGPFTVFAPNNAAFAKIPADKLNALLADVPALKAIILRHGVAGNIPVGVDNLHLGELKSSYYQPGVLRIILFVSIKLRWLQVIDNTRQSHTGCTNLQM